MLFSTCWRWLHGGQQQPWVHLHDVKHWALEALQVETVAACAVVAASTPLRFEQVHPELRLLWLARSCRGILEVVVPRWRHSSLRRADVTAADDRECVLSKLANLALDIATADCGDVQQQAKNKRLLVAEKIANLQNIQLTLNKLIEYCPGKGKSLSQCNILNCLVSGSSTTASALGLILNCCIYLAPICCVISVNNFWRSSLFQPKN